MAILLLATLVYSWELYKLRRYPASPRHDDRGRDSSRGSSRDSGESEGGRGSTRETARQAARQAADTSLRTMLGRPQVWNLNFWPSSHTPSHPYVSLHPLHPLAGVDAQHLVVADPLP